MTNKTRGGAKVSFPPFQRGGWNINEISKAQYWRNEANGVRFNWSPSFIWLWFNSKYLIDLLKRKLNIKSANDVASDATTKSWVDFCTKIKPFENNKLKWGKEKSSQTLGSGLCPDSSEWRNKVTPLSSTSGWRQFYKQTRG